MWFKRKTQASRTKPLPIKLVKRSLAVLRVEVAECSNLFSMDYSGKGKSTSDPYVEVTLGETKLKFKTRVEWGTLQPVFEKIGHFFISDTVAPGELKFEVWDKDIIGKDDYLGEATLTVKQWFSDSKSPERDSEPSRPLRWDIAAKHEAFKVQLKSKKGHVKWKGEIALRLGFLYISGRKNDFENDYKRIKELTECRSSVARPRHNVTTVMLGTREDREIIAIEFQEYIRLETLHLVAIILDGQILLYWDLQAVPSKFNTQDHSHILVDLVAS
ncbi:Phospholipase D [Marasmius tenuissimus]|uniref:Phospholipase D n=1 Tax=Marasmius tenuissimus TaxID=585030 RepID=A0ABR2Z898_9AGAR